MVVVYINLFLDYQLKWFTSNLKHACFNLEFQLIIYNLLTILVVALATSK